MTQAYVRRALLNPGVYAAVLLALVLVIGAYQARPSFDIPIGTATDGPLLGNFHDAERPPQGSGTPYNSYRWSKGDHSTITFQDVGRQDFDVMLQVNGSRPAGEPPPVLKIRAGEATLLDVTPPQGVQTYTLRIPRE